MARELVDEADVKAALAAARTVAVLGVHDDASRPAHYVPDYLAAHGYRLVPVNPAFAGQTLWGEPVRASLAEVGEPVDIVDVFRRPELLPGHVAEILAMSPRPKLVWLQQGIRNDAFAKEIVAAGIDVVQDRCTLADHRRFGLGRPSA
ncbi:MAG TPA: CoA-binding protein [Minicystis sp.]|nr:CoA-binding protein [Minicystis sp.]